MKKWISRLMMVVMVSAVCSGVQAQGLTGRQVSEKAYGRDDGKDSTATFNMVLVDKRGKKRKRTVRIITKDAGELVNTFIEFTAPTDIEGTRFLTIEVKGKDDTQHLFLPALGRSRRIVGGQKKQSFVNTDYTYEDMERRHPDEDKHTLLKEEKVGTWDCYVVENVAVNGKDSQYSKVVAWVDKKTYVAVKVNYYDKKNRHVKQLRVNKMELKDGIWTIMDTVMENLKRKTKTLMTTADVKYNQGLDDKQFTVRKLEEK